MPIDSIVKAQSSAEPSCLQSQKQNVPNQPNASNVRLFVVIA